VCRSHHAHQHSRCLKEAPCPPPPLRGQGREDRRARDRTVDRLPRAREAGRQGPVRPGHLAPGSPAPGQGQEGCCRARERTGEGSHLVHPPGVHRGHGEPTWVGYSRTRCGRWSSPVTCPLPDGWALPTGKAKTATSPRPPTRTRSVRLPCGSRRGAVSRPAPGAGSGSRPGQTSSASANSPYSRRSARNRGNTSGGSFSAACNCPICTREICRIGV
jgi:hypothetical protein